VKTTRHINYLHKGTLTPSSSWVHHSLLPLTPSQASSLPTLPLLWVGWCGSAQALSFFYAPLSKLHVSCVKKKTLAFFSLRTSLQASCVKKKGYKRVTLKYVTVGSAKPSKLERWLSVSSTLKFLKCVQTWTFKGWHVSYFSTQWARATHPSA